MKHGVSGFQSGCRCEECYTAERNRMREIGKSEQRRWSKINIQADERWIAYVSVVNLREPRDHGRRWTPAEISIARDKSVPVKRVAAKINRSLAAVSTMRYRTRH